MSQSKRKRENVSMEVIAKEIKKAFAKIGYSGRGMKSKIAEVCGVSNTASGSWFSDTKRKLPTLNSLVIISNLTKTSLDQLIKGEVRNGVVHILKHEDLISYLQVKKLTDMGEIQEAEKIENSIAIKSLTDEIQLEDKEHIGLINPDESMEQLGTTNYYPKNSYLVFSLEKDREPKHQDLVLVKITVGSKELIVFRQFLENGKRGYFRALNPSFETIADFDDYEIIGYLAYHLVLNKQ